MVAFGRALQAAHDIFVKHLPIRSLCSSTRRTNTFLRGPITTLQGWLDIIFLLPYSQFEAGQQLVLNRAQPC